MPNRTPVVLVPGLLFNAVLWSHQLSHCKDVAHMRMADTIQGP